MTYKVSLSRLFNEQLDQIKELDTALNSKRVAQSIKPTAKELEKMQKSGYTIETTRIKRKVPDTPYTVVYKVVNNPSDKLIAKKVIKHR